jgi:excisionase family DNA binding protein
VLKSTNAFQAEGLSVSAACVISGLGRTRLYEAMASGALKARKFGKRRIILRTDLMAFLASLPTAEQGARSSNLPIAEQGTRSSPA